MRRWTVASLALLAACGTRSNGEPPPISGTEVRINLGWPTLPPEVRVLVVDDGPDADAAALRSAVIDAVREAMSIDIEEYYEGPCGDPDPAAWHPTDLRFVIAWPSAPDAETLLTPILLPPLAITTEMFLAADGTALADAVDQALALRLRAPGESYRPIRAVVQTAQLFYGLRLPATDEEEKFRASLPKKLAVGFYLLSTRDDEETTPVKQLELPYVPGKLLGTSLSVYGPEKGAGGQPSRLAAWAGSSLRPLPSELSGWLFATYGGDCSRRCLRPEIAVAADGSAICKVTVDHPDLAQCDPARGWRDPDGQPEIVDVYYGTVRRCEVAQLTGAALESCRHSLDCPGCPSGWCKTEVPELLPGANCAPGYAPFPFRFVGGAKGSFDAAFDMRCLASKP